MKMFCVSCIMPLMLFLLGVDSTKAGIQNYFGVDCSRRSSPPVKEEDTDADGIADRCEQLMAEKFAPIVYHSSDESNFPTNVEWFLSKTALHFYHFENQKLNRQIIDKPSQAQLLGHTQSIDDAPAKIVRSDGTRSQNKLVTFFLADVDERFREGSLNSRDWTTYFHAYRNIGEGITIQYWRFYAFNDALNDHGGDWEGIHIILDKELQPARIGLLGHEEIDFSSFSDFQREGNHAFIFSEGGGHGSRASGRDIQARGCGGIFGNLLCTIRLDNPRTFVRQETWSNGDVNWFDGRKDKTGPLLNIGEKLKPMNGQFFIRYSGLWGNLSKGFPPLPPGNKPYIGFSGYWGPSYNETGMGTNYLITAWADGMLDPNYNENHPNDTSP